MYSNLEKPETLFDLKEKLVSEFDIELDRCKENIKILIESIEVLNKYKALIEQAPNYYELNVVIDTFQGNEEYNTNGNMISNDLCEDFANEMLDIVCEFV